MRYPATLGVIPGELRPPEDFLQLRSHLARAERFGHELIRAHLHRPALVLLLPACGEHDDVGVPGVGVLLELAADLLSAAGLLPPAREGRLREALFSIWAERIPGARFLDLFAGSGAVALEALSRGAATAVAIDGNWEERFERAVAAVSALLGTG